MPSRYLPGQQPRRQRAPDRRAVAGLGEQPGVLLLDASALEDVVLRLLGDRLVQVVALGDLDRAADLVGGPLARAPVQRLAGRHDVAHRPHRLLERRVGVGPVAVEDVDEVGAEPLERAVDGVEQVLAVERVPHVRDVVEAPVHLRGQHVRPSWPAELGDDAAHDRLALAAGVGLGVVEEVAAGVVGRLHALHRQVVLHLGVERHPRAERQHRQLEPGAPEPAVLHSSVMSAPYD